MSARALAAVALLLLAAGCTRSKDPYQDLKPAQLRDMGDRLVREGDLGGAERAYRVGLERATKAGVKPDARRFFTLPMFHLAAKREDLAEAQRLYAALGVPDLRATHDLAVLLQRAGRRDEARAMAETMTPLLATPAATSDDRAIQVAAWMTIDRLRTASHERDAALEATQAVIDLLKEQASQAYGGRFQPLPRGLRPVLLRYLDFLFATDRDLAAREVGEIVARIDENAPPAESDALCIPLFEEMRRNFGCLLEPR